MEDGASQTRRMFSLQNQRYRPDDPLQLRLFFFVFLIVVEGKLKGLVQMLAVSLIEGAGEGVALDALGSSGISTAAATTSSVLPCRVWE